MLHQKRYLLTVSLLLLAASILLFNRFDRVRHENSVNEVPPHYLEGTITAITDKTIQLHVTYNKNNTLPFSNIHLDFSQLTNPENQLASAVERQDYLATFQINQKIAVYFVPADVTQATIKMITRAAITQLN